MIGDVLQVLVLLAVVIGYFRLARRAEDNLYLIFAALSTATLMISTVYYVTHSFLREGMRVPFAANDIADFGTFLLMSAALRSALGTGKGKLRGVMLGAAAFAVANVCLWICWSGEWVRDILGGLSFGYFICICIRSVYLTEAMERWERAVLWILCAVLIAVQVATLVTVDPLHLILDTAGYGLLSLGEALLMLRIVLTFRAGNHGDAALSLCYFAFCWNAVAMYMSAGVYYTVFANLMTLYALLVLFATWKKVKAA